MIVQLRDADADTCGGKASALGMLVRAGLPVPDGFVVPFDAYRAAGARQAVPATGALLDAISRGLHGLGDPHVAVRSSASGEDTAGASAAGQHESILAVRGVDGVADAVRTCWASLHSPRAVDYRAARGQPSPEAPVMAVLVQRLVDADVSGVMFTPVTPDGTTEIEASWGLGPSVVGGTVTPDAYRVTGGGAVTSTPSDKRTRLDREGTCLVEHVVSRVDRSRAALDDATVRRLAQLGQEISARFGEPQDVEWALAADQLWILQARPITATPPSARSGTTSAATLAASQTTLTGTPGSHGTVTGPARIVRGPGDFVHVTPGDILICPYTDPAWTPLLRIAAGVVTETGGALSHAAIVARELRIPAVLGVPNAISQLDDGATITIDGTAGTLTAATA